MPILKYQIHKFFNRPRSFSNDIALIKWVHDEKNVSEILRNIKNLDIIYKIELLNKVSLSTSSVK